MSDTADLNLCMHNALSKTQALLIFDCHDQKNSVIIRGAHHYKFWYRSYLLSWLLLLLSFLCFVYNLDLEFCISERVGGSSMAMPATLLTDALVMVIMVIIIVIVVFPRHHLSTAQCVVCKVYFSAQPNNLKLILNFQKYYPIEHIFVPACSSARKIHFFKFWWFSN